MAKSQNATIKRHVVNFPFAVMIALSLGPVSWRVLGLRSFGAV